MKEQKKHMKMKDMVTMGTIGIDDWQEYEVRDYKRERSQRRSKGYEKGEGKGYGKSKSKEKEKGKAKGSYYRRWWQPSRISVQVLMEKLLRKGDRHQAEWQEMPRNKLVWESLKGD